MSHTLDHTHSFSGTLTALLDSDLQAECDGNESESTPLSSGSRLCKTLLDVYEGSEVTLVKSKRCGLGVGLVAKVLCLLLASSQTAKQTALKGPFILV